MLLLLMCYHPAMTNQQAGNKARAAMAAKLWADRRKEIVRLYHSEGLSQAAVAEHYGVTQASLQKVLKRLKIKSQSRGRMGAANGRFVDGSQSVIYRKMIAKGSCAKCSTTKALVIHHKDDNHTNNVLSNLQVLCSPCHTRLHKSAWWRARASRS